jgi:predicted dehydrogenase
VGLVGANAERTAKRAGAAGIGGAFSDLDAAIEATGARAVAIATPPNIHAAMVHTAVRRGCHVLCEKPFARDAAEARTLLAAAEAAGVVHIMGNQFRFNADRALMARAIGAGAIGEPRLVTISQYVALVADPAARRPGWWFDREQGGGWLGASGSHMIDMIRTWLGEFASLSAATPILSDRTGVAEDSYLLRFTMKSGVEGTLMQTGGAWGQFAAMTRVAGTDGTLWIDGGTVSLADRAGTRALEMPDDLTLPEEPVSADPAKPYLHIELPPARRLCEAWRAAIAGEPMGPVRPANFADGVAAMEVIDAIRASAAAGGALVEVGRA